MATDKRVKVTLACEECKRRNYITIKSKVNDRERIEMKKYCRWDKKHTLHRETRYAADHQDRSDAPGSPGASSRSTAPGGASAPGSRVTLVADPASNRSPTERENPWTRRN